jgi:uncharacterized protein YjbI with pentapeptide repeats
MEEMMANAAATTEQFEVRNRWTNRVQFTAEITCAPDATIGVKIGLAVKWARRNGADLRGADLSGADLSGAVLRDAVLRGADLSGADLSGADLSDAVLRGADLSGADLSGAVLSDAVLRGAVLSGADLSGAVLRDAVLRDADLSGADLSGAVLRDAVLSGADLSGADLSGADLSDADLSGAVLSGAVLRDAVLRGADLRGADWIPKIPNIHQAIYKAASKPEALDMSSWHRGGYCGTTHCRAGWAVVLAGPGGRVLEGVYGTGAAAALIYQASDPKLEKIPNWIDTNEGAMADMKRLAEAEAA